MKKTLQQLVTLSRSLISRTDNTNSEISDSELTGFANEGVQFVAAHVDWPRDQIQIQVEKDVPSYPLLSDTMKIKTAYFGDQTKQNEPFPLDIMTEEKLKEYRPNWLSQHSTASDRPRRIFLLNRKTIAIDPPPNEENSAAGKMIFLTYVYYPAVLVQDTDYPDLPDGFHDFIPEYMAHKCYMGKLKDPTLGLQMLETMLKKVDLIKVEVTSDFEEKYWGWGNYEDVGTSRERVMRYQF